MNFTHVVWQFHRIDAYGARCAAQGRQIKALGRRRIRCLRGCGYAPALGLEAVGAHADRGPIASHRIARLATSSVLLAGIATCGTPRRSTRHAPVRPVSARGAPRRASGCRGTGRNRVVPQILIQYDLGSTAPENASSGAAGEPILDSRVDRIGADELVVALRAGASDLGVVPAAGG